MKNYLTFALVLSDFFIPLIAINLFGDISLVYTSNYLFISSLVFSFSILLFTLISGGYSQYFFTHMDAKLKFAFNCWIFSIFIQFLYFHFLDYQDEYSISINLIVTWILIPNVILISKFIIKNKYFMNKENSMKIFILGDEYKFTTYELKRLAAQNYSIKYVKNINEIINEENIDFLIINKLGFTIDDELLIKDKHNEITTYTIPSFLERHLRKLYIRNTNITLLSQIKPYSLNQYFIKRSIDFSVCIFFIPLLIITFPIFYFFIKIQSPGRIFFHQTRNTMDGNEFKMYKFRTMHDLTDKRNSSDDSYRIYPFGRLMRRYRLDELPQIINVLLGNMHISGPRAEWNKLNDSYTSTVPFYKLRYAVKSGITGWAQVMFRYGYDSIDAKQKLMYDLYYIKNWSIWLDIEIGLRTILVILGKKGS